MRETEGKGQAGRQAGVDQLGDTTAPGASRSRGGSQVQLPRLLFTQEHQAPSFHVCVCVCVFERERERQSVCVRTKDLYVLYVYAVYARMCKIYTYILCNYATHHPTIQSKNFHHVGSNSEDQD